MNILQDPVATNAVAHLIAGVCYLALATGGICVLRLAGKSLAAWDDRRRRIKKDQWAVQEMALKHIQKHLFSSENAEKLSVRTRTTNFPFFVQISKNSNKAMHPNGRRTLEQGDIVRVYGETIDSYYYNGYDITETQTIRKDDVTLC